MSTPTMGISLTDTPPKVTSGPMTPERWKAIEERLSVPYGTVRLRVDGYDVALQVHEIKRLRFSIFVYVNGYLRGSWLSRNEAGEWCEEARRFLQIRKVPLYNQAKLKKLRLRKKHLEELCRKHLEMPRFNWTSFGALKRHLIANNKSIEYVADDR